jgi:hypothetical protein
MDQVESVYFRETEEVTLTDITNNHINGSDRVVRKYHQVI